ncbi:MAG: hypothetical protein A3C54_03905 [Deltaproteobacteria bacterium RIFCSPHIGHO2_02_FULL_60_17]|nr:MAG: hypothetical protein A3C54_03905 [Deltaproteobacteria bacterium RIFCSPHIGHO2_02_FULL_60_17]OGQ73364.1 MAG: hypothetical protein A3G94_00805 [Deltaproteobacteria bacterium RIFCSPLOWO2_12_FULL_60_16]
MKEAVRRLAGEFPMNVIEVDVDSSAELRRLHGDEVPVLFINGRKAFKYRVTANDLKKRLRKEAA